ncbi:MAG TPA: 2-phospho-L-lactate transferase CofD family protein, partial [Kribbella sp.]
DVASTAGHVVDVALDPADPPACPEALVAIAEADWVVVGPGSWFTSVIPNLLVPELCRGLEQTSARRLLTLNLGEQKGETDGFSPETHLEVLAGHAPDLRIDVVLADTGHVPDPESLRRTAQSLGAELVIADIADEERDLHHAPDKLAKVYREIFG